jgi:hypothetical protein
LQEGGKDHSRLGKGGWIGLTGSRGPPQKEGERFKSWLSESQRPLPLEYSERMKAMKGQNWNERCAASLKKERAEIEAKYNIRIGQTDIHCATCGKAWSTFHDCSGMDPERRNEVERLKRELGWPWSIKTIQEWQEEFEIEFGMTKEEAFEKFLEWQASKKTCQRCEGEEYAAYCPVNLICKEAMDYESRRQIDIGSGTPENLGFEEAGVGHNEEHSGFNVCEGI